MMRFRVWVILLMISVMGMSNAQAPDPFAPYQGIPMGRTADGAFVLGSPDAPVTIVEFADFMCPHCQNYHDTAAQFIQDYVKTGQARFEYRLFPIVHPTYSVYTAQLAECAEEQAQGGFWAANDVLYGLAQAGQIGPDTAETLAVSLNISAEKLDTCAATATQYQTDLEVGQAIGVSGTPATLVRNAAGELGWAYLNEQVFERGGLPLEALAFIASAENPDALVLVPQTQLSGLVGAEGCVAPCWRDILAGETLFDGVVDFIRAERQFYEISEQTQPTGAKVVLWQSRNSGIGEPSFILSDPNGIVEVISILEVSELTLGEVLDVQGEPEYATGTRNSNGGVILYAFYPSKSMVVLAFVAPSVGLTGDAVVIGAQFFNETRFKALLNSAVPVEWVGFDGLDTYLTE